jgi:hypothetical protein
VADELTRQTFDPHVGSAFRAGAIELELVEVSSVGRAGDGRSFALLFRGPSASPLGQGTVELEHVALGSVLLFLVPVAADATGLQYEAVFNRLPPGS